MQDEQEMLRRSIIQSADPESDIAADDDALARLLDQPLDLNSATEYELVRLPGVTPRLANMIVAHRRQYGNFATIDSLATVAGLSRNDVELLAPFVFVDKGPTSDRNAFRLRMSHLMQVRPEQAEGFSRNPSDSVTRYLGGPVAWTTRIDVETQSFQVSVTADHDRGEPWQWRPSERRFGADHLSWSIELRPGRVLRSIVLGDIRYASRMGLAAGTVGFASFERPSRAASHSPPRGHSGPTNPRIGRGVAVRIDAGPVEMATIVSRGHRDARREISPAGDSILVLNSSDRNHRTEAELARRKFVGQRFVSIRIGYKGRRVGVGVFAHNTSFDKAVSHTHRPDQLFAFEGRSQSIVGVDVSWHSDRTRCAAEAIVLRRSGTLALASTSSAGYCEVSPGRSYRVWTYARILSRSSSSLTGTPLSRSSGLSVGERGISFGLRSPLAKGVALNIYADLWRHPWLRFNLWRPSGGRELGLRLTRKTQQSTISIKINEVTKDTGVTTVDNVGRSIRSAERIRRTALSFSSTWWLNPGLGVRLSSAFRRTRGQQPSSAVGAMLSVGAQLRHSRLQLAAGMTLFDSPSAATRIYAYEPSMRFAFGAVSHTGSGERWYVLLTATVTSAIVIEMKYSSSSRYGARTIGSGLEEVKGNRIRDVGLQIVFNTPSKS